MWTAAHVYIYADCTTAMKNLKKKKELAHKWLAAINPKHWSHAHFIGQWYVMIMSSVATPVSKGAKQLMICCLKVHTRKKAEQ